MKKDIFHYRTGTLSIRSMLFDFKPRPVFYAPSVITQTVPCTYQVVNTRLSLVWLLNAITLHIDSSWKL